ncbi:MAG: alkaline phosphatase family protein [Bacillota bacterium]
MMVVGVLWVGSGWLWGGPREVGRVIVLGIDGMDYHLTQQWLDTNHLPNISRLKSQGSSLRLLSTTPPLSPVAWSTFATGLNPGRHGIYDFLRRDPAQVGPTLLPADAVTQLLPTRRPFPIPGTPYAWPPRTEYRLLRTGPTLWEILEKSGVKSTVYKIPANFPATGPGQVLAGMGTPDIEGTYGIFAYFTSRPEDQTREVPGGRIFQVIVQDGVTSLRGRGQPFLPGPINPFLRAPESAQVSVPFDCYVDSLEKTILLRLQDQQLLLQQGQWSPWVPIDFPILPYLKSIKGFVRFYLQEAHPHLRLYVSPINLAPGTPGLATNNFDLFLYRSLGPYFTKGMPEETKALLQGLFTPDEYLTQANGVLNESLQALDLLLTQKEQRFVFFYFSTIDLTSHVLWRHETLIRDLYIRLDQIIGHVQSQLRPGDVLYVLSDHGFAPQDRRFNLVDWLQHEGYLVFKPASQTQPGRSFAQVDWSQTRAYALGFQSLYLNLQGREPTGIVPPHASQALINEIRSKLLCLQDGKKPVFMNVYRSADIYTGPRSSEAPDLILGYARGFGPADDAALGIASQSILADQVQGFTGNHACDPQVVPGVLFINRKLRSQEAHLEDVTATILSEFNVTPSPDMVGHVLQ